MVGHAHRRIKQGNLPKAHSDLLQRFIEVSTADCQAHYNRREIIGILIKYGNPKIIISTEHTAHIHPIIMDGVTFFCVDEASRTTDASIRSLIATTQTITKAVIAGDKCQLGPFSDLSTPPHLLKYGKMSILDVAMRRSQAPVQRLTINRRAIEPLTRHLRVMTIEYSDMTSGLETPDFATNLAVKLPPLPMRDSSVILLHVPSKHHKNKFNSIVNNTQDKVAIALVQYRQKYHDLMGLRGKQNVMVVCNYNGDKTAIENRLKHIKFSNDGGVRTVEGAQGKQADHVIWVIGRTRAGQGPDFSRDDLRAATAAGRPGLTFTIVTDFDFATNIPNSWLYNYIVSANDETPILDGLTYIKMLDEHFATGLEQKARGEQPLDFFRYGNGVLMRHLNSGEHPEDISHIAECTPNIHAGWLDLAPYVPPDQIGKDYEPPQPELHPYDAPLPVLPDEEEEDAKSDTSEKG
jgi:hypothetical protein